MAMVDRLKFRVAVGWLVLVFTCEVVNHPVPVSAFWDWFPIKLAMSRVGEVGKPRGGVRLASVVAITTQLMAQNGPAKRAGAEMPNLAFDPGHGPVYDPTIHRHHVIGHPPIIAPPGAVPVNAGVGRSATRVGHFVPLRADV